MSGYHFDADKKAILPIYTNKSTVDLPYFEHVPDLFDILHIPLTKRVVKQTKNY